ncbi:MAG: hypothetical protein D3924_05040, partial [Candidatus Electrothrix sp. AR4]|nr:hypothetical protein [Candidatus Electrothrix sp. AR4]
QLYEPVSDRSKEIIIKIKPSDKTVLYIAQFVAEFCRPGLGHLFSDNPRQIGLDRSHTRELAIYQQTDIRFKQHTPSALETIWNEKEQQWALVLEAINRPVFQETRAISPWPEQHIRTAIQGLSRLHSIWYRKEKELQSHPQLYNAFNAEDMEQAAPLWAELAEFFDTVFGQYYGTPIRTLRNSLIEGIGDWWQEIESMDRTLIHHDFNPRNIMINMHEGEPSLCAFDWELAAMGLPQRDLAELLCFVLPENHESSQVQVFSELHRQELERACGCTINAKDWKHGLRLALFDILICRIPLYTVVHRIKPQPFLLRVIKNCISMLQYPSINSL